MTGFYKVKFRDDAAKEWKKLGATVQKQFAKKLKLLIENPHIPSARLSGLQNCYKIKLKASGYRLVYEVVDNQLIIIVVTVGKRNRNEVYDVAKKRL
ncbi:type II toxin-antitoxin system RelE/ParE family toxin [Providencia rettgeri]|uniref:type II toxin-antitoxin system RelE family toxin n=1 Tax=Providencia TaxID=586 RepID=UPI000BCEDD78|nr:MULTISPECIES: type II toxin-antitoxin system RelE/ParE family toxin [Providencia]MBW3103971.1 type II toxin-antitoxin system RelE/ParE family toxin [Providencia rettgeri]PCQ36845.1 type II toxin-antitoxin system mRNA interferase toxin, RelE/StbE family [Providencia rettgeri]BBU97441.1 RelE toxin [Providencia rettgeri]